MARSHGLGPRLTCFSSACRVIPFEVVTMKIHEYQAKQILARYGVRIPRGEIVYSKDEARRAAERLGGTVVVKAQIHAGGRGKGGGVKVAKTAEQEIGRAHV